MERRGELVAAWMQSGLTLTKRPFSSRFARAHTPVPSQYSIFSRERSLLGKQKTISYERPSAPRENPRAYPASTSIFT